MLIMSKIKCNLCLAANRRNINITNTYLQTLYEKLANFKVSPKLSLWLCYVCHTRLKQCHQLSQLAKQTRCFLSTGLLQTNIKLKSHRMGLVSLSRSPTAHFTVPDPNSNCTLEVLVKKEPRGTVVDLVYDDKGLDQYKDMVNTEDWRSDDNKDYTKDEKFRNEDSYFIELQPSFKNKVEIEINTNNGANEVPIKEEIIDEIKKEILEDDDADDFDIATIPETVLYTCTICKHMFSTLSLLRKHKATHSSKLKLKDKLSTRNKVVCPVCGKYYADKRVLARHLKLHSAVRPFSCEICNKTFSRRDHYNKHALTHPGLHLYSCRTCHTHYPNSAQLKAHHCAPRDEPAAHACDVCGDTFERWDQYHAHKTDVHGVTLLPEVSVEKLSDLSEDRDDSLRDTQPEKAAGDAPTRRSSGAPKRRSYSCAACDVQFGNKYQLETHRLVQHKRARYECDHCGKVFLRRTNLCQHMRTHAGDRRFCCDACGKTFTYRSSLNTHRRVHTGAKPYACDVCARRFTAFGQLAEHKLVHTDERPFPCELCRKAFKRRRHLKKHMSYHTGEKPYTCDVCFKSFARNDNFVIHQRIHTGEKPFVCDVCGTTFSENRHLKKHRAVHE